MVKMIVNYKGAVGKPQYYVNVNFANIAKMFKVMFDKQFTTYFAIV